MYNVQKNLSGITLAEFPPTKENIPALEHYFDFELPIQATGQVQVIDSVGDVIALTDGLGVSAGIDDYSKSFTVGINTPLTQGSWVDLGNSPALVFYMAANASSVGAIVGSSALDPAGDGIRIAPGIAAVAYEHTGAISSAATGFTPITGNNKRIYCLAIQPGVDINSLEYDGTTSTVNTASAVTPVPNLSDLQDIMSLLADDHYFLAVLKVKAIPANLEAIMIDTFERVSRGEKMLSPLLKGVS